MDQYLLISCLQKSIRRGHADLAIDYAKTLLSSSEKKHQFHLKYRLAIIAVEDIGIGSWDAITPYLN